MQQNDGKGLSIAGLVLGIASCAIFWMPFVDILGLALAIVGLVLSSSGKKNGTMAGIPTGMATAGLVLSIIGVCLNGVGVVTCTICGGGAVCAACEGLAYL